MNVLVVGSGGREHALVWKLAQSRNVTALWCAPGNGGTAGEQMAGGMGVSKNAPVGAEDIPALLEFARKQRVDLTVVGPDNPLALGIVDEFQRHGLRIWGPNRSAARFESSKAFAQDFMERHGIPTARSGVFSDPAAAQRFSDSLDGRCAVKADGLALGKGVLLCREPGEARRAIDEILISRAFGAAGNRIVIQELLEGIEISMHALCDGTAVRVFPTSQDHKRALDGDQGLNTGGMGTYSPTPFLHEPELTPVAAQILNPWLRGCAQEGIDYRGILYPGVMLTAAGPKVLEFNARFGDPETQVYLPLLENDLLEVLLACVDGRLHKIELRWSPLHAVCVVMASGGYPGSYAKGLPIFGLEAAAARPRTKVFHAGTAAAAGPPVTAGGRVLGVTAWAPTLSGARDDAYAAVDLIRFEGAHHRRDIAAKALR